MNVLKRTGRCNCGEVTFQVEGDPVRIGICHCLTCRKETGSAFNHFAVWPVERFSSTGKTASWISATDHRHFCPQCGSRVFGIVDGTNEVEVRVGALDVAPSDLLPTYELWIPRRENWLVEVADAEQHNANKH